MSSHLYAVVNNKLDALYRLALKTKINKLITECERIRNKLMCIAVYAVGDLPAKTLRIELNKHNILGLMDCLFLDIQEAISEIPEDKLINGDVPNRILYRKYRNGKIKNPVIKEPVDICKDCDRKMISITNKSKLLCEGCGEEREIISTFCYELAAINVSKTTCPKDYSTVKQCQKWLHLLQGRGDLNISDEDYNCIRDRVKQFCLRDGKVALGIVRQIRCEQIRKWLKLCKLTKYNRFIPLLRRRITRELGAEVIPPQFNFEEEKIILADWLKLSPVYSQIYKKMKKQKNNNSTNIPYYPICILRIVKTRWAGDPRIELLDDCVHKQSHDTMSLRYKCWKKTCELLNYK